MSGLSPSCGKRAGELRVITQLLLGLEKAVGLTVLEPVRDERGWTFRNGPGCSKDPGNGFQFLSEAYRQNGPGSFGRVTVPVLWDKNEARIVNHSEDDICRSFNDSMSSLGNGHDIFAPGLQSEQDELSA